MSIQYLSKANGAAKLYHWGINQVPIPPHHAPVWRQFVANLMPILYQSSANPLPILPILCQSSAIPLQVNCQCNTNPMRCDVNPVPIWGQSKTNGWLSPTPGVSMHCQCDANGPIRRQSTANLRLICQSITNLLISFQSWFNLPIHYQSNDNPWLMYQSNTNTGLIRHFIANLPIQNKSIANLSIWNQSIPNLPI